MKFVFPTLPFGFTQDQDGAPFLCCGREKQILRSLLRMTTLNRNDYH